MRAIYFGRKFFGGIFLSFIFIANYLLIKFKFIIPNVNVEHFTSLEKYTFLHHATVSNSLLEKKKL